MLYDAPADYDGSDPGDFTYSVSDGNGGSDTGVVDIAITEVPDPPGNNPPVATDNAIAVTENSQDTPLGLAAPTDADGDALTITVTGLPSLGSVTKADGTALQPGDELTVLELQALLYDAPADYDGSDPGDFTYSVSDGNGGSDTGVVDIAIDDPTVNDPPTAVDEAITVAEGTEDTPINIAAPVDPEGDPLTITVTELPNLGTVTKADGTALEPGDELTVEELQGLLYDAPADYDGSDPGDFTYSVSDGNGGSDKGVVDIAITEVPDPPGNNPPVATDNAIAVTENSQDTPLGLAAPTDADGDALTITVTGLPSFGKCH